MCGFAGIALKPGHRRPPDQLRAELAPMSAALRHRGPDGTTWRISADGATAIAFDRLAIVDVAGGRQPVAAGPVWGVLNGEIYDHLALRERLAPPGGFASRSDAEVLPHAWLRWGPDAPAHFNGMFAFALVDERDGSVALGRDRFGVKPLFVHEAPDAFYFASEIKGILAHPAVRVDFDWPAAIQAIGAARSRGEELHPSFFRGIEVVEPGAVRVLRAGRSSVAPYWTRDPAAHRARAPVRGAAELVDAYRSTLEEAVRSHLMADVELGLFLSGGVDSVAIAALAARHTSAFHCFTVAHRSTEASGDLQAAKAVSDALGLPLHPVAFPDDAPLGAEDWPAVVRACELHLATVEQFFKYHLHAAVRRVRPAMKVVLLGQGSDELTGGYSRYQLGESWAAVERALRVQDLKRFGDALGLTDAARALGPVWLGARPEARAVRDRPSGDRYWASYVRNLDYHLWLEDRVSSAHGIEARVPFLDVRLAELLFGMPTAAHGELLFDKAVLRRAMAGLVPPALAARPKGPFFYGPGQGSAMRLAHRLMRADGEAAIARYLGDSPEARAWIDVDLFRAQLHRDDPDAPGSLALTLLAVLSMGVLAELARDARPGSAPAYRAVPLA